MSTIREKAEQYMEKHFPESDFEDLHITTDQLVDGIPQAINILNNVKYRPNNNRIVKE